MDATCVVRRHGHTETFFWDHLRSNLGIICGTGIICGPGLFAGLHMYFRSYQVPVLLICPLALSQFLKFKVSVHNIVCVSQTREILGSENFRSFFSRVLFGWISQVSESVSQTQIHLSFWGRFLGFRLACHLCTELGSFCATVCKRFLGWIRQLCISLITYFVGLCLAKLWNENWRFTADKSNSLHVDSQLAKLQSLL